MWRKDVHGSAVNTPPHPGDTVVKYIREKQREKGEMKPQETTSQPLLLEWRLGFTGKIKPALIVLK